MSLPGDDPRFNRGVIGVLTALVVGILVVVVLGPLTSKPASTETTAQQSTSAQQTPPIVTGEDSGDSFQEPVTITKVDDFAKRVLEFEEAFRSPPSSTKQARLAKVATKRYMHDHSPPANQVVQGDDVIVRVSHDLITKTHYALSPSKTNPNIRRVLVSPSITTMRRDSSGHEVVIMHDIQIDKHQLHTTDWILVDHEWRVDEEL